MKLNNEEWYSRHITFQVGSSFNIELEVRPRTKTAVLLSVGILEYLTLYFLNGTIKFTVDNGAGPETVSYVPSMTNALCDGHWHHIKVGNVFDQEVKSFLNAVI